MTPDGTAERRSSSTPSDHFPPVRGGVALEGDGNAVKTLAALKWAREADVLAYWGDIDAEGLEILDRLRDAGLPAVSMLMDTATYERYARYGTGGVVGARPVTTPSSVGDSAQHRTAEHDDVALGYVQNMCGSRASSRLASPADAGHHCRPHRADECRRASDDHWRRVDVLNEHELQVLVHHRLGGQLAIVDYEAGRFEGREKQCVGYVLRVRPRCVGAGWREFPCENLLHRSDMVVSHRDFPWWGAAERRARWVSEHRDGLVFG